MYIWENPKIYEQNKERSHSIMMPYDTLEDALAKKESAYKLSLNGTWKFYWQMGVENVPADFWKDEFDHSSWADMPVPSVWQLNGYGKPIYLCNSYPDILSSKEKEIPKIDHSRNEIGIYHRTFEIPAGWDGREIYIYFTAVKSAFKLYVNGEEVGYSQGSMNGAEFNLTKYVKVGTNSIVAEVYRYSDGSYLEDQDMWFLSGIYRDVYLYAEPKLMVRDFYFKTDFDGDDFTLSHTSLDVYIKNLEAIEGASVSAYLLDGRDQIHLGKADITAEAEQKFSFSQDIKDPKLWSAEYPNTYTLVFLLNKGDETICAKTFVVGFKKMEIRGNKLFFNGKEIMVKGVNRHEFDPDYAWAVPKERFHQDLSLIKRANCNSIRTSHYPNSPEFYEMCNEYGIYVMDECDCETHGVRRKNCPGDNPIWTAQVVDRMERMVLRDRNYPCIFIWSLGNEAGDGSNFMRMKEAALKLDDTRKFHYEGDFDFTKSDFISRMYPEAPLMKAMGEQREVKTTLYDNIANSLAADNKPIDPKNYADHPVILCEYAHAMENSLGNFKDYMADFEKYENMCGGYIWDFVDQSIHIKDEQGDKWLYGGDFDEGRTDAYFCANGIIGADRKPHPAYYEVKHVYGQFSLEEKDASKGIFEVFNKYSFTNLSDFSFFYTWEKDGEVILDGDIEIDAEPKTYSEITVSVPEIEGDCSLTFNLYQCLKEDTIWAEKDFIMNFGQIRVYHKAPRKLEMVSGEINLRFTDSKNLVVFGPGYEIEFKDKRLCSIKYNDVEVLKAPLVPNYFRALTDNDFTYFNFKREFKNVLPMMRWRYATKHTHFKTFNVKQHDNCLRITSSISNALGTGKIHYVINAKGDIFVRHEFKPIPNALRIGMTTKLNGEFSNVEWLGRGPAECYLDRKTGSRVSKYNMKVRDIEHRYMRPQENGNREDCDYVSFSNDAHKKIVFSIGNDKEIGFSAWNYTQEALFEAEHLYELAYEDDITVNIDYSICVVGGDMPGMAHVRPQYKLKGGRKYVQEFVISNRKI